MNRCRKYLAAFSMIAMMITTSNTFANFLVVTPDQVVVNNEGLFVSIDGTSIPVGSLSTANDGYIVAAPNLQADICPQCGHDTYTDGRWCANCDFPFSKLTK